MTQRIIEIESPFFIDEQTYKATQDLNTLFPRQASLALEIGCGIGDFIVARAQQFPEVNFVAIDIYNKGCLKTCRKLEAAGVDNVRVIRAEARTLLTEHLPEQSLCACYINCPDPWPKKRHRKRRLVNADFLELLRRYLVSDGEFYFATDFDDYGIEVGEVLHGLPGYCNQQVDPHSNHLPGYPSSKYMERFLALGQPIYYCHYRRDPAVPLAEQAPALSAFRVPRRVQADG